MSSKLLTMTLLTDYQIDVASTAEPRAYEYDYLIPGIVGEIGEMFGHKAKAFWHGTDRSERIIGEYGDIAWMCALLLKREGISEIGKDHRNVAHPSWIGKIDGWTQLLSQAHTLQVLYASDLTDPYREIAQKLWVILEARCEELTGADFQDVLDYNIQKLASRAAKGTLHGDGDGTR